MTDAPFPFGMLEDIARAMSIDTDPPGLNVYDAVFNSSLFFPLQRQRELAAMMRIARTISPRVVYEIGSDKGGGLYHWCKSLTSVERVIACEIRGTPYRDLFERHFPEIEFLWIEGSSYAPESIEVVRDWLGKDRIDCLFIDGDKGKFAEDFDVHLPLMSNNGIVFMHDINDSLPEKAFQKVKRRGFRTQTIVDIADAVEAMGRERDGIPSRNPHESWLRHWRGSSCGVGVIYLGDE